MVAVVALAASCNSTPKVDPGDLTPVTKFDYDVKGVSLKMIEVPGDSYTFGITSAMRLIEGETVQQLTFDGYAISETPITVELYKAVMGGSVEGSSYAEKISLKDAQKFASKLSSITGQKFSVQSVSEYEYASRYGFISPVGKFKEWVIGAENSSSKDIARTATELVEYLPGTKASGLGFRVSLQTNKPCDEAILAAMNGKIERETGEKRSEFIEVAGQVFMMIGVPAGTFLMGGTEADQGKYAKEDELPVHQVALDAFEIGQTEVTVGLWNAVMGSLPTGNSIKEPLKPVINVSWYEAQRFILKLNEISGRKFRLPTESEWEYAARGCVSYSERYSGSNKVDAVAVYGDDKGGGVHEVMTKAKNALRAYDFSGNAWEWCQDYYGTYPEKDQFNPTGPQEGSQRVLRGGSVSSPWNACRVSNRSSAPAVNFKSTFGLRLAL